MYFEAFKWNPQMQLMPHLGIKMKIFHEEVKRPYLFLMFSSGSFCPFTVAHVNTLRPRQNGRHFADDIFKCIFVNGNVWIPIKISLKFVPKGPISNIPALVQIMAWRRAMMVSLPTHICVTRPQWVNWWCIDAVFSCWNFSWLQGNVSISR